MITKIILSGGGINGIALLGSLEALHELKILDNINLYLGTSIGSIISLLLCIGYEPEELYNIILSLDFSNLYEIDIKNIFSNYGLDTGDKIKTLLYKLLNDKGFDKNISFINLYNTTKKHLYISVTILNTLEIKYFDYINNPDEIVIDIIMRSISIPGFFCPIKSDEIIYVDGALLDSFPNNNLINSDDSLGILIYENYNNINIKINSFEDYLVQIYNSLFKNITSSILEKYKNKINIIKINVHSNNTLNFNIDKKSKDDLFIVGYNNAINFKLLKKKK